MVERCGVFVEVTMTSKTFVESGLPNEIAANITIAAFGGLESSSIMSPIILLATSADEKMRSGGRATSRNNRLLDRMAFHRAAIGQNESAYLK
jgi:hypothetical protein